MCGVVALFGHKIEIPCEILKWPYRPPIDFTQIIKEPPSVEQGGPNPTPWREQLSFLSMVLAGTTVLHDRALAKELGTLVADIGNKVAKQATVDVTFGWDAHAGVPGN
jgi:hypothetical protein